MVGHTVYGYIAGGHGHVCGLECCLVGQITPGRVIKCIITVNYSLFNKITLTILRLAENIGFRFRAIKLECGGELVSGRLVLLQILLFCQ